MERNDDSMDRKGPKRQNIKTRDDIQERQCSLGASGVNVDDSDIKRFTVGTESNAPICQMCDRSEKSLAGHLCETCNTLYCESCLKTFHPKRGPLEQHVFTTVPAYTSQLSARNVNRNVQAPAPPGDHQLRVFLLRLSKNIDEKDLEGIKFVVKGVIGSAKVYGCETILDLFDELMKGAWLTPDNLVILQTIVWHTERRDLYNELEEFANNLPGALRIRSPDDLTASPLWELKTKKKGKTQGSQSHDLHGSERKQQLEEFENRFADILKDFDDLEMEIQEHEAKHVVNIQKTQDQSLQEKLKRIIEHRYSRLHADRLKARKDLKITISQIQEFKKQQVSSGPYFEHIQPGPMIRDYVKKLETSLKGFRRKRNLLKESLENDQSLLKQRSFRQSSRKEGNLLEKVKHYEAMKDKVDKRLQNVRALIEDIESMEKNHRSEQQRAYDSVVTALDTWLETGTELIRQKHKTWLDQCGAIINEVQIKLEEAECLVIRSCQEPEDMSVRFDQQLQAVAEAFQKQEKVTEHCNKFLKNNAVQHIQLNVTEKIIKAPVLKFTKTNDRRLRISDNGFLIEGVDLRERVDHTVWTDGELQSGQHTWGLEITVLLSSPRDVLYCYPGVVRGGCGLWSNAGTTSWHIGMQFCNNQVICYRPRKGHVDIKLGYYEHIPHIGPYRLGFSLNCNEYTLTITDTGNNRVMAAVKDIDLSQPVIPAVEFFSRSQCSVSARLFHWYS